MNKSSNSGRLAWWLFLMQEFDINIIDKPGKANVVVDFLSRLQTKYDPTTIDDSFPNENLFSINVHTPWYADIANC